jgi:Protein of unknown function (DUF1566)
LKTFWLGMVAVLILCLGLVCMVSCGDDDDDDDDDNGDDNGDDDDNAGDDDDDNGDDDDNADDDDDDSSSGDVWVDTTTGFMWQKGNLPQLNWAEAKTHCDGLEWGGLSDWHLPTISELRTLIRGCEATAPGGACGVTDSCLAYDTCWDVICWSCEEGQGPANGNFMPSELLGSSGWHWSSSDVTDYADWAWAIPFFGGDIDGYDGTMPIYVRCVH